MTKIYPYVTGNTLESHEEFLQKLTQKGAKVVKSPEESNLVIVFCPIVSRFEADINAALASTSELGRKKMILVAMHLTFVEKYSLPSHRGLNYPDVILLVDCLYFEGRGLLACPRNEEAVQMVCEELELGKNCCGFLGSRR